MLQRTDPGQTELSAIYAGVARAIAYLAENHLSQPSLDEAARIAGFSPFHFQREFTRLAGVSPKAFLAHLTLEHAKTALKQGASVLSAALDAGLSGPSRLHDLALKVEAMTPGDYAKGGSDLVIRFCFHPTLFGPALIMATERGLCGLAFADEGREDAAFADMRARWPKAHFVEDHKTTAFYWSRIFPGLSGAAPESTPLPVQLFGTKWQIKIWQALLTIPEGSVTTYGALATRLCSARASRAAGTAIGRNPIALLIPCHRVLAANGAIAGYHWGTDRKRALLALEAAYANANYSGNPSTSLME